MGVSDEAKVALAQDIIAAALAAGAGDAQVSAMGAAIGEAAASLTSSNPTAAGALGGIVASSSNSALSQGFSQGSGTCHRETSCRQSSRNFQSTRRENCFRVCCSFYQSSSHQCHWRRCSWTLFSANSPQQRGENCTISYQSYPNQHTKLLLLPVLCQTMRSGLRNAEPGQYPRTRFGRICLSIRAKMASPGHEEFDR